MQDYRVHITDEDGSFEYIPYFCLPAKVGGRGRLAEFVASLVVLMPPAVSVCVGGCALLLPASKSGEGGALAVGVWQWEELGDGFVLLLQGLPLPFFCLPAKVGRDQQEE